MVFERTHKAARITVYEDAFNKRIRIDDYSGNITEVIQLIAQTVPAWTEKIIVKSRPQDVSAFMKKGYCEEAHVKGYFAGIDMHFVTRYPSRQRQYNKKEPEEEAIIDGVLGTPTAGSSALSFPITYASSADAHELAKLYRDTFPVYPTPLGDPEYILKTMTDGTLYVYIKERNKIVAAASAEINKQYRNAELTDCATAEGFQGKGYMRSLLLELERNLRTQGITCLYTIARAESFGMNKAFHDLGFAYTGRMTNNCFIFSGLEDMNVWYKF